MYSEKKIRSLLRESWDVHWMVRKVNGRGNPVIRSQATRYFKEDQKNQKVQALQENEQVVDIIVVHHRLEGRYKHEGLSEVSGREGPD